MHCNGTCSSNRPFAVVTARSCPSTGATDHTSAPICARARGSASSGAWSSSCSSRVATARRSRTPVPTNPIKRTPRACGRSGCRVRPRPARFRTVTRIPPSEWATVGLPCQTPRSEIRRGSRGESGGHDQSALSSGYLMTRMPSAVSGEVIRRTPPAPATHSKSVGIQRHGDPVDRGEAAQRNRTSSPPPGSAGGSGTCTHGRAHGPCTETHPTGPRPPTRLEEPAARHPPGRRTRPRHRRALHSARTPQGRHQAPAHWMNVKPRL